MSGDIQETRHTAVESLVTLPSLFVNVIEVGTKLLEIISKDLTSDIQQKLKDKFKVFFRKSQKEIYAYLNVLLFNQYKHIIFKKYGIKINKKYKHFWYLKLYSNYLINGNASYAVPYVFIDEAQDLSISEIRLIAKLNYRQSLDGSGNILPPILNIFGDVKQTISNYGISDWQQVDSDYYQGAIEVDGNVYTLDENFRNPNQIIDYCNSRFSFKMKKIGVNMEEVSEYDNLYEAYIQHDRSIMNAVFIVKDEYAKMNLQTLLNGDAFSNIKEYEILTVKDTKGLEFTEIYVFDKDMTTNECYVAYTRALVKLNIIKELPESVDRTLNLYEQGEDDELSEIDS